jgi:hypothetical protein
MFSTIAVLIFIFALTIIGRDIAGTWKGTSLCTIKDSPCHDEQVVYLVEKPDAAGNMRIQMDKVVNGKQELMGTLKCNFDRESSTITCPMKDKEWKFTISGNKMDGTLILADGRLYRRISVTKNK